MPSLVAPTSTSGLERRLRRVTSGMAMLRRVFVFKMIPLITHVNTAITTTYRKADSTVPTDEESTQGTWDLHLYLHNVALDAKSDRFASRSSVARLVSFACCLVMAARVSLQQQSIKAVG